MYSFFIIIHGDICTLYYWICTLYMASRRTSCILFEFAYIYIYIYIYGNKQLIVSDADSLTFIAQSSEECVRSISFFSAIGSDFMNNLQHSCASRVHSLQATKKYIHKFTETERSSFWRNFITDCTGRQLPVQPVMKISSKYWYFRFSARTSWIILTFRADLVHVYITLCGHVYSYKRNSQYTSSM